MTHLGYLLAVVGLLLLLGGLASPPTQTNSATTCVNSRYDPADGCVETTYTTPNYGRGALITLGVGLGIGGLALAGRSSDAQTPDREPESEILDRPSNTDPGSTRLHERMNRRRHESEDE